ncbi:MAG: hypothetical protein M0Z87_06275 [Actinomycetota bacterium]|nr:hypothetical protein [Actinomycetota bacterium]
MTWLAWRVQRSSILASVSAVSLVGVWLVAGGFALHHSTNAARWTELDVAMLFALPCFVGLAVGAPLVGEELDRGTVRLAWSQEASRGRWLGSKLLVATAAIGPPFALLAGLVGWWSRTLAVPDSLFTGVGIAPADFDVTGPAFVSYALFAFALGILLGALLGRPIWAFVAGVPTYVAVRSAVQELLRPRMIPPLRFVDRTGDVPAALTHAWVFNAAWQASGPTARGAAPPTLGGLPESVMRCVAQPGHPPTIAACARLLRLQYTGLYQPPDRYWVLQGIESAIFLALAFALCALGALAVRHHSV